MKIVFTLSLGNEAMQTPTRGGGRDRQGVVVKMGSPGVIVMKGHPIDGAKTTLVRRASFFEKPGVYVRFAEARGLFKVGHIVFVKPEEWKRGAV